MPSASPHPLEAIVPTLCAHQAPDLDSQLDCDSNSDDGSNPSVRAALHASLRTAPVASPGRLGVRARDEMLLMPRYPAGHPAAGRSLDWWRDGS